MPHLTKSKNWLPTPNETASLFDGSWKASIGTQNVTAIISRRKIYAKADFMADIKLVSERTCVAVLRHEDVRGELSLDGNTISWSDGDQWLRSDASEEQTVPLNLVTAFDGAWEVMSPQGIVILQIARKKILWHDDQQTLLNILSPTTCSMVLGGEAFEGELSEDRSEVEWSDGDVWIRRKEQMFVVKENNSQTECIDTDCFGIAQTHENKLHDGSTLVGSYAKNAQSVFQPSDAADALMKRDVDKLRRIFESGIPVTSEVNPTELWHQMRWDPSWSGEPPVTTLLVAAILLQWPQGVELCIRFGADVNSTYCGPFRCADGSVSKDVKGAPILRVGLSARDHMQSLICGYILNGKVYSRTFQSVKKKAKGEMAPVTENIFRDWLGPFYEG